MSESVGKSSAAISYADIALSFVFPSAVCLQAKLSDIRFSGVCFFRSSASRAPFLPHRRVRSVVESPSHVTKRTKKRAVARVLYIMILLALALGLRNPGAAEILDDVAHKNTQQRAPKRKMQGSGERRAYGTAAKFREREGTAR